MSKGYGLFCNADGKTEASHRVSWRLHTGAPSKLFVLHKCDNRLCVNPAHLFEGTHQENMDDMKAKGRSVGLKATNSGRHLTSEFAREVWAKRRAKAAQALH